MIIPASHLNTERHRLVNLLAAYGINDPVLSLFEEIPREIFVERRYQHAAYEDRALPTSLGQTISQPSLVALTLQTLELKPQDKVLEIGTGSGFQTALLAKLARVVYSIERLPKLATLARARLTKLGLANAHVVLGDGSEGYAKSAPYDVIIVTAAFWNVPKPLAKQLKEGGRLVMPVGHGAWQKLMLYQKRENKLEPARKISDVRFVPLVGKHAYNAQPTGQNS